GGEYQGRLAEDVMNALKRRVDPDGVKNLVWRPQGNTRLEIQMPRTARSDDADAIRQQYADAQATLEATNVRRGAVVNAVEQLQGEARTKRIDELAGGDPARAKLLADLAAAHDRLQAARSAKDADAEALASIDYDKLRDQIDDTNLTAAELQGILEAPEKDRQAKLDAFRKSAEGFPARLKAIDQFTAAHGAYQKVRSSLDDAGDLKRLLRGSGVLEWHILVDAEELSSPAAQQMIERLQGKQGIAPKPGDTMQWMLVDQPEQFGGYPSFPYNGKTYTLAWTTPEKAMTQRSSDVKWGLEKAYPTSDGMGGRAVGFEFNPEGARLFSKLTGANLQKPLAAVLDDKVISAANINSQIGRSGIITRGSGYAKAEFDYLINTLNAGSLPARLADDPISERTVGPQLGADNLRRGLLACALGLAIVSTFMIAYYYLAGVVAAVALVLNLVLICGTMAAINATFTLPGVAGVVLTIGASVDANVLIFERLREEQARGLPLRMALKNAYSRASSAIIDSNATTVITSLILVWLGTEEVKGFGLTLLIGLVWSLFTSLFVTRTIFDFLVDRVGVTALGSLPRSFPAWERMLLPNVKWMDHAWKFAAFSAVFIGLGMTAFLVKLNRGELLDVEFSPGTAVQVELKERTPIEDVRRLVDAQSKAMPSALPSPSVVAVSTGAGDEQRVYEIITPNDRTTAVREAVTA
ncbi:MAG TPA: protein translocase subunit SecD, partial [Tepidisphaeraceae bacterium]|nr:protein translocase subunit SecD [Tepidisphaeraceae bacterium]